MKKEDFLAKVKAEVAHLKSVLTAEQKGKINFSTFNPHLADKCLLGQIFGRFDNPESVTALPKSVWVSVKAVSFLAILNANPKMRFSLENHVFSETSEDPIHVQNRPTHFTFMEAFLTCNTNSEDLFKFLKDEVEEFEPSFIEVPEIETV